MPDDILRIPLAGFWYRHVPSGASPMPGHPAPDGRWQRGEQVAGLYLAQDLDTVWAEWYRALAELGAAPRQWLPRDLWRLRVDLDAIADMTSVDALRAIGLQQPVPDRAQWSTFQDAGARLAAQGFRGVLFSSSAHPAGRCLCVFQTGGQFIGVTPVGEPERIVDAPAPPRGMRT